MKKAFEIYNKDMRSANKQYTQYNIPSAYALMLTHKDTVPRLLWRCTQMMVNIWLKITIL
ncbi:MAG: glycoside hydrolase family 70 protein [Streptococcus sp.]